MESNTILFILSTTVGEAGNVGVNKESLGGARIYMWLGKPLVVRGVVLKPVEHPKISHNLLRLSCTWKEE
jgi:ribosomal protein L2